MIALPGILIEPRRYPPSIPGKPVGIDPVSTASMRGRLWQLLLTEGATQAPVMEKDVRY